MPTKILVVDDELAMEHLIQMGFRRQIRGNTYSFQFALNGQEALNTLQEKEDIDIILCDINMPIMNGLTFLKHMKEKTLLTKTIMVTAYGNMENIRAAMNGGAFDFITKPIDFPDLNTTIENALEEITVLKDAEKAKIDLIRTQEKLGLIEEKAEHMRELDEMKSRFFANISHEFRTPLTIIQGMAEQIEQEPEKWALSGSKLILENSKGLIRLVKQILDLRKLETGYMDLQLVQANIIAQLKYIFVSFQSLANSKGIDFQFQSTEDQVLMDFDPDKLLSIMSNLISNAIKFSEPNTQIRLEIKKSPKPEQSLLISLKDEGIGIASKDLEYIFERFFQTDKGARQGGTGIGLALSYELVKMLDGKITVSSEQGQGSCFQVLLPIRNESPLEELILKIPAIELSENYQQDWEEIIKEERLESNRILLVDDHPDILQYMISCLAEQYQVYTARNGKEALDKALDIIPDLIISDAMMPEMDGYEFCEALKADERSNHIPIIMLTAKADIDSKLKGLDLGIDAFMAKPFHQEELKLRIKKLLELRKQLQARYQLEIEVDSAPGTPMRKQDFFIQKFKQIILEHLDETEFNVPKLCKEIGMSRPSLHRKVKALTGLSTTHFIQNIRLHQAEKLLKNSEHSISEIAYLTGFSNPAYFSRSYKNKYGLSPSKKKNESLDR